MWFPDSAARPLTRRQAVALGAGAFAVLVAPAALRRRRRTLVTRTIPVMGTTAEVMVVHDDPALAQAAIDDAFDRLRWVDRTMTRFDPASDLGRANLGAARDAVAVHPATALVVAEAIRWAERTEGRFDPALARVTEAWDLGERTSPPAAAAYRRLAGRALYRRVEVGSRDGRPVIRYLDADVGLDLGGIAKGYGVDRAVEALRAAGIRDAVVNAGGDLFAIGRSPEGDPWRVGVRSPHDPARIGGTIEVEDAAVATSGDYFQGFDHEGRRYHHIMDPATAEPVVTVRHSVTVMAGRCLEADAAATAVFGLDPAAAGLRLRMAAPEARLVSTA